MSVCSSTDWLDGPEMIEGRTSVGPEDNKGKYFTKNDIEEKGAKLTKLARLLA